MKEEQNRLRCEKVLNESWAKLKKYNTILKKALKRKRGRRPPEEEIILSIASRVAGMQLILDHAQNEEFGLNIKCSKRLKNIKIE